MVLDVMLTDKMRDGCWIVIGGFVAAAVDRGVDEELDGVFQRCVDKSFALVFFARLVGTSGGGGLFDILASSLLLNMYSWCIILGHQTPPKQAAR